MLFCRQSPPPESPHRVVVTGLGLLTPLGATLDANSQGFQAGRSAIGPVTLFDVSRHRAKTAAELHLPANPTLAMLRGAARRQLDRAGEMLLWTMQQARDQAQFPPGHLPIYLGTTGGGMSLGESYYQHALRFPGSQRGQPTRALGYQAHRQAALVREVLGLSGPILLASNACASGANAIGLAWQAIRNGRCRQAFAGGYDALCSLVYSGFDSLQALSVTTCRPFAAQRDGLVLGEGAAILALESQESAQARGAKILAEIVGYGAATDLHHLTQPHPQGDAALRAMREACAVATLTPDDIDYINAHGTGTPLNDSSEAHAISQWLASSARPVPVSSTKANIGHLLGASGAVEAAICILALLGQWFPPMLYSGDPDPACQFPLVRQPTSGRFRNALSNSFGFGGSNAALLFHRSSPT